VSAGDLATDTVYANNIIASEIATFLLRALSAVIIGQDYEGTPPAGAQRVVVDDNEFKLEEYDGSTWTTILRLGGNDMLKWYLQCRGVIKTGADISGLSVGDKAPNGSKIFDFEDDYQDQAGSDPWDVKTGTRSFTTGKFLKGLTGNVGSIRDSDAQSADWGASFGVDAWLKLTTVSPPSPLDLLRIGSRDQAPFVKKTPAEYDSEASRSGMAWLSATDFIIVYEKDGTTYKPYAKIGQVAADGSITYGSAYEVLATEVYAIQTRELTSTKIIVIYRKASDSYAYAKIATISGTTISFGSEVKFSGTDIVGEIRACQLSDSKFVCGYYTTTGPYAKCVVGTVSDTTVITFGSVYALDVISTWFGIDALSDTLFVIAYCSSATTKVRTASVSGTVITYNTAVQIEAVGCYAVEVCKLTMTKFAVFESVGNAKTLIGTVSGTDITLYAASAVKTGTFNTNEPIWCHSTETDRYLMVGWDNGDDKFQCWLGMVNSDNTVTVSSVCDVVTDSAEHCPHGLLMSRYKGVVAYCGTDKKAVSVWTKETSVTLRLDGTSLKFNFINRENSIDLTDAFAVAAGQYHVSINWNYSTKTLYYTVNGSYASRSLSSYTLDSEALWLTLLLASSTYANVWDDLLVLADALLDYSADSIAHYGAGLPWVDPTTGIDALMDLILLAKSGGEIKTLSQLVPLAGLDWPTFYVEDQKSAGTHGGTFSAGAWRTRDLNTIKTNTISGASLASNQIILPAGIYDIEAHAPVFCVDYHKLRLYNITAAVDIAIGTQDKIASAESSGGLAFVRGRLSVAANTVIELQQWCTTTGITTGFGIAANINGKVEIYSDIIIRKVA
jgi:hypothetical protein